jgi:hypothetical protein
MDLGISIVYPLIIGILADVGDVRLSSKSIGVRIGTIKLEELLSSDLEDQCPSFHTIIP